MPQLLLTLPRQHKQLTQRFLSRLPRMQCQARKHKRPTQRQPQPTQQRLHKQRHIVRLLSSARHTQLHQRQQRRATSNQHKRTARTRHQLPRLQFKLLCRTQLQQQRQRTPRHKQTTQQQLPMLQHLHRQQCHTRRLQSSSPCSTQHPSQHMLHLLQHQCQRSQWQPHRRWLLQRTQRSSRLK